MVLIFIRTQFRDHLFKTSVHALSMAENVMFLLSCVFLQTCLPRKMRSALRSLGHRVRFGAESQNNGVLLGRVQTADVAQEKNPVVSSASCIYVYIYIYVLSLSFDGIYLEDSSRVTFGSMQVYFCESSGWAAGLDMHQTGNIYFWNTHTDEVISGCARTLRLASILVLF